MGKSLLELYNENSASRPYVNEVRDKQSAAAGEGPGVNFLDGIPTARFTGTAAERADVVQNEFQRNGNGAFLYGGDGKVPGAAGEQGDENELTRWKDKALNIAFGTGTHPHFGDNNLYDNFKLFRGTNYHNWTPTPNKQFRAWDKHDAFTTSLIARGASPKGPSPSGLGG